MKILHNNGVVKVKIKNIEITEFLTTGTKKTIIVIYGKVDSLNKLLTKHWYLLKKEKNYLTDYLIGTIFESGKQYHKYTDVDTLSLSYSFADNIARDYDNYSGKLIIDAIKNAGLIKDDSCKIIKKYNIEILLGQEADKIKIVIEGK